MLAGLACFDSVAPRLDGLGVREFDAGRVSCFNSLVRTDGEDHGAGRTFLLGAAPLPDFGAAVWPGFAGRLAKQRDQGGLNRFVAGALPADLEPEPVSKLPPEGSTVGMLSIDRKTILEGPIRWRGTQASLDELAAKITASKSTWH